mgnify:FL=1
MVIDKKTMQALRGHIGKKIKIEQVCFGRSQTDEGVLKKVIDFESIVICVTTGSEPVNFEFLFIGHTSAIRRIINSETGEILYDNPSIPSDYARKTVGGLEDEEVDEVIAMSFGSQAALERQKKREAERAKKEIGKIDPIFLFSDDFLPK